MKIKINKYMLSHDGKIYQADDTVDIADKKLAISLVENSNGNLELCRDDVVKAADENTEIDETAGELPDVDPIESIGKKGKK